MIKDLDSSNLLKSTFIHPYPKDARVSFYPQVIHATSTSAQSLFFPSPKVCPKPLLCNQSECHRWRKQQTANPCTSSTPCPTYGERRNATHLGFPLCSKTGQTSSTMLLPRQLRRFVTIDQLLRSAVRGGSSSYHTFYIYHTIPRSSASYLLGSNRVATLLSLL